MSEGCPWPMTTSFIDELGVEIKGIDVSDMSREERLRVCLWLTEKNTEKEAKQ